MYTGWGSNILASCRGRTTRGWGYWSPWWFSSQSHGYPLPTHGRLCQIIYGARRGVDSGRRSGNSSNHRSTFLLFLLTYFHYQNEAIRGASYNTNVYEPHKWKSLLKFCYWPTWSILNFNLFSFSMASFQANTRVRIYQPYHSLFTSAKRV